MDFKLDMTMMFAIHDALRRELVQIARITDRVTDDPQHILRSAAGWQMFKSYLHVHHTCEDDMLWPVLEQSLASRPDDLALLAALEAEHAAIDPLLAAIDAALPDRDSGPEQIGGLTDALVVGRYSALQLSYHALGWAPTAVLVNVAVTLLTGVPVMTSRVIGQGRRHLAGAAKQVQHKTNPSDPNCCDT